MLISNTLSNAPEASIPGAWGSCRRDEEWLPGGSPATEYTCETGTGTGHLSGSGLAGGLHAADGTHQPDYECTERRKKRGGLKIPKMDAMEALGLYVARNPAHIGQTVLKAMQANGIN